MNNPVRTNYNLIRDIIILVVLIVLVIFFTIKFWSVFFPFILSVIIAYLLNPLIGKLNIKFNMNRIWAVLLIYFVFFLGVGIFIYISIPMVIKEFFTIQHNLPSYISYIKEYFDALAVKIHGIFPNISVQDLNVVNKFLNNSDSTLFNIFKNVPMLIQGLINLLMLLILVPFITFFLLKDGQILKKRLYELIPNQYYELYRNLAYRMDKQLGNYIRGQALDALICGILTTIGLWIIGVKYFVIIGMLAGIANLIPYFGPFIGLIMAVSVSILDKGFNMQFILVIGVTILIVQLIDNLLVNPVVVGKSVDLHPLVVMIAIMLAGEIGGLLGMLLVVPFVSVLRIVIIELSSEFKYRKYIKLKQSD
ncbi:MAG: AI-2E family transporter [Candidatus Margulisbacteria bacterium]|nr:AI-2E family transporter [Candidatus Margulisiibacteriota bacterium]